ncbi:hypothetical protein QDX23_00170 [Auritidibacter ignavus]|uniref:hypothetical protein n=1 Tax=Auritidibacter ignavus TaxID=678932 RepID=UPI0011C45A38|nr:hypothetical protein [Auritidibacter ignavus]WGH90849.1 hypothetical protein QDX23_00170 [Auritidibacter ignavus]
MNRLTGVLDPRHMTNASPIVVDEHAHPFEVLQHEAPVYNPYRKIGDNLSFCLSSITEGLQPRDNIQIRASAHECCA